MANFNAESAESAENIEKSKFDSNAEMQFQELENRYSYVEGLFDLGRKNKALAVLDNYLSSVQTALLAEELEGFRDEAVAKMKELYKNSEYFENDFSKLQLEIDSLYRFYAVMFSGRSQIFDALEG